MKKIIILLVAALFVGIGNTVSAAPKVEKKSTTTVFVTDIDCPHCSKKVLNTIPFEKGVKDVRVDVPTKTITVTYDPAKNSDESLCKALENIKVKVFSAQPAKQ